MEITMIKVTFPDGAVRDYALGTTGTTIVEGISKSLAKKTVAMRWNGELADLSSELDADGRIEFVLRDDPAALELIRHDAAHVLAEAVQELWPDTQVTIGPVIENGFYYDFYRAEPFSEDDLRAIEKKMEEIVDRGAEFTREVWDRDEAKKVFGAKGEQFKVELIDAIPADQQVKIYKQGQWFDLCRGPHMRTTKDVGKAFKLTKVAGAYWRGDSNREVLSRIYGTAWASKDQLDQHLHMIEEAEKRDHRKIGQEMDLYHFQHEAQGSVFWHPKGFVMYNQMEAYIRRRLNASGYREIKTPQLLDNKLWEKSGHWGKFRENMFVVPDETPSTDGDQPEMTQDDAHIFCRIDQIQAETEAFCALLDSVYADMGFTEVKILLATRPETRAGEDSVWDLAEKSLGDALKATGRGFEIAEGEGAFYGPKLEFHLKDAIGRSWQCGTLQLDFVMPERLEANYMAEDGSRQRPVMLHRAILGSLERFLGMMIESYAGRMPLWLAPVQVVVATIVSDADDYANQVVADLRAQGIRAEVDTRNESINYKVREHSVGRVPFIFVAGRREAEEKTVSIRRLGSQGQTVTPVAEAIADLVGQVTPPDLKRKSA
eukprot:jgi/Tetstr1/451002/TSEL_038038.t1